jgi:integrase
MSNFTATPPYLDPEHPDAGKYLRLVFQLKSPTGQQFRIRESLGLKATTENHKLTVTGKLRSLNLALLREDWAEVARLCPNNSQRFTELRLLDGEITATVAELLELHRKELVRNHNRPTPPSTRAHVLEHFGPWAVADVTPQTLVDYQDKRLAEGASNATINRELSVLRAGFTIGLRVGRITKAFPKVKFLQEAEPREGFFEEWEVRVLLKYLPEHYHNLVWTAYYTGWRKSELLNLKRSQLSPDGVLSLAAGTTKNKQRREYYVNADPQLKAVLEAQERRTLAEYPETEWMFHFEGQRIRSRFGAWDRALAKATAAGEIVGKRWFHNFRRTAMTNHIASGMPTEHAKKLCGHLTDSMVTRYNMNPRHLLEESIREAAAARGRRSNVEPIRGGMPLVVPNSCPTSAPSDQKVEQTQGKLVNFPLLMNQAEK